MFDFYKPEWLYEALPYLYIAAGGATLATFDHSAATFSGALLIMTGAYVLLLRKINRSGPNPPPRQLKPRRLNTLR
ncbi:MAG: hypothetical protein JWR68_2807 [Polaromonas sp.]|nr:hypothetical protein [Polaromonas sp.]